MGNHTELLINYDSGEASNQNLVDWAISQIQKNKESESLNELAWLTSPGGSETRKLFLKAIEELNYILPSYTDRKILLAKKIAEKMLEGKKM
ncbi:MAG: hypothetical protein OEQ39_01335 [Gammaproteobacteria bacterium]|nr:hypothetical protein [Gammaproteobacteria bacterium]MDH3466350.1 hypothetical protein [Gammaproteobacteria bacterium]